MSFVRKSTPPPKMSEGDIVQAMILEASRELSNWTDEKSGEQRWQIKFELELSNNYTCLAWITYYDRPSDKSKMGKLVLILEKMINTHIVSADDFIEKIKAYGRVYVKVSGCREYKGETYPKIAIYEDKLPPNQQTIAPAPAAVP
jgi:hypothetical protein